MSKSVCISEEFHEFVTAHKRENETIEETLRRLIGGPHPEDVAGILSSETAAVMRDRSKTSAKRMPKRGTNCGSGSSDPRYVVPD